MQKYKVQGPEKQVSKLSKLSKPKTQKCQPAVRDTPGPLQGPHPALMGVGVPDGGLTRPTKNQLCQKCKNTKSAGSKKQVSKLSKLSKQKTQKCQPAVRDTPGPLQGPHPALMGVGVPDGGLTCPTKTKISEGPQFRLITTVINWLTVYRVISLLLFTTVLLPDSRKLHWKVKVDWKLKHYLPHIFSLEEVLPMHWKLVQFLQTHKKLNKLQQIKNGNRCNQLKIIHWNGGPRQWKNKLVELEALLIEHKPDLCYITEANLWAGLESHEMEIPGHSLVMPNTMGTLNHARIVLIVRDGLNVMKLNQYMDTFTATIWVKVGTSRRNSVKVGGIYRELRQLGQGDMTASNQEVMRKQEQRWDKVVKQWKSAGNMSNCIVLGDLNLDHRRWQLPEQQLVAMVQLVKDKIETTGFSQLVNRITRSWNQQADSILDHIWVNCPNKVINHFNIPRGASDHNIIGLNLATMDLKMGGQNTIKRKWANFDKDRCMDKFRQLDWTDLYKETNPEQANSILVQKIEEVIESEAPMGTIQHRTKYQQWLTGETK